MSSIILHHRFRDRRSGWSSDTVFGLAWLSHQPLGPASVEPKVLLQHCGYRRSTQLWLLSFHEVLDPLSHNPSLLQLSHTPPHSPYTPMHKGTHMHAHTHTQNTCTHVHTHSHTGTHSHSHVHIQVCACIPMHTQACTNRHAHIHKCTYSHTGAYIQTQWHTHI